MKFKFSQPPKATGVYAFKKGKRFLYIGKAVNLRNRVQRHKELLRLAEQPGYIKTGSEEEALLLEAKLIKKYQPKYNKAWKDDKNYFYVGVTKEAFPRVFITHQTKNDRGSASFIGPFVDGKTLRRALEELRKTFPYRTCKTIPKKPCLWYNIKQCPAPCLFNGQRLEAYDISNIQGKEATGSMVTFINGKSDKNFYRRFKIKTINRANDVAMLKEVLTRRFNHPEWGTPDLILIDGGKAQLNAALRALPRSAQNCALRGSARRIMVMALAKKNNELYIEGLRKPLLLKEMPRETFNLILQARDEAHRFAKAYHHILRKRGLFD